MRILSIKNVAALLLLAATTVTISVGHHIDTILKVAKIFNIECDIVCR